ncbi:uncharacterized protein V1510DRAFT_420856 [Dipodascopsis tothii]|uniref:uncharacterized protein n=1 Tax=Dipodascopsis tothii TaxID=44089 RepID=UPI0034CD63F9
MASLFRTLVGRCEEPEAEDAIKTGRITLVDNTVPVRADADSPRTRGASRMTAYGAIEAVPRPSLTEDGDDSDAESSAGSDAGLLAHAAGRVRFVADDAKSAASWTPSQIHHQQEYQRELLAQRKGWLHAIGQTLCCCGSDSADDDHAADDEAERHRLLYHGPRAGISPVNRFHDIADHFMRQHQRARNGDGVIVGTDPNVVYDVLHENQRGVFVLGKPFFSANGLLNYDPSAWVDLDYRHSPVDTHSATVPDPSWEWVWRTWYVDMTDDVDDQGWAYSLSFTNGNWHGSHVWFHSFVRRRRWLRKRKRVLSPTATRDDRSIATSAYTDYSRGGRLDRTIYSAAEGMNNSYFTVQSLTSVRKQQHEAAHVRHMAERSDAATATATPSTGTLVPTPADGGAGGAEGGAEGGAGGAGGGAAPDAAESTVDRRQRYYYDSDDESDCDEFRKIPDIGRLLSRLKSARLDREKIEYVEQFVAEGDDQELPLLASLMGQVMSFLIFQESRRALLRCLLVLHRQIFIHRHPSFAHSCKNKGKLLAIESAHPGHVGFDPSQFNKQQLRVRRKAIAAAVLAARAEIDRMDYYSDRKSSTKAMLAFDDELRELKDHRAAHVRADRPGAVPEAVQIAVGALGTDPGLFRPQDQELALLQEEFEQVKSVAEAEEPENDDDDDDDDPVEDETPVEPAAPVLDAADTGDEPSAESEPSAHESPAQSSTSSSRAASLRGLAQHAQQLALGLVGR